MSPRRGAFCFLTATQLTARRLRNLGPAFGMSDGFERVHWILDEAFDPRVS